MKFRKINDNTVNCILSEEDMEARGVTLEDFFTDKEKTRDFLEEIVKQAQEQVGYETSGETLAMQVMPLPHNGLSITLSERSDHGLKDLLGHIKSAIEEVSSAGGMEEMIKEISETDENTTDKKSKKKNEKKKSFYRVYEFSSMSAVENYCTTIAEEFKVKSQLYKDTYTDKLYLVIEKGRLAQKNLEKICMQATEFSTLVSDQESYVVYCKEHYRCLIKKGAVKVLRNLAL